MACGFCATGQAGFERHLTSGEIVEQVVVAARRARPRGSPDRSVNVVFMGMGEPFANYDATLGGRRAACTTTSASAPATSRISTVGILPGIRRLAERARCP